MRDLSSFIEIALAAETGKLFWFMELQFDTTLRYTDCDIDLWGVSNFVNLATESEDFLVTESDAYLILEQDYSSNKFETMPFSIPNINYSAKSSVDTVTIDIQNVDLQMSAVFLNEDIRNKWVILWLGLFDDDNVIIDQPIEIFRGLVSTWRLTEPRATITLVNEFIFWNKKTLRKHQSACRWAFNHPTTQKGVECAYSESETWCDQSYARCTALGNTDNFGGHRWLPSLMDTELFWGRSTSK